MDVPRKIAHPELEPEHKEPSTSGPYVLEQVQKSFRWRTKLVIGVVVLLIVIGFLLFRVKADLDRHRTIPYGVAAPWAEQLAVSQEAIPKTDQGSILRHVSAMPVLEGRTTVSSALRVQFAYVTSSGNTVIATVEDTHPATLVKSTEHGHASIDRTMLERIHTATGGINISPREAIEATIPELEAGTGQEAEAGTGLLGLYVSLALQDEFEGVDWPTNSPAVWSVLYVGKGAYFMVDAQTGEVVRKDFDAFGGRETPTPTQMTP